MKKQYIIGWIDTKAGKIPKVSTKLSRSDKCGTFKVRCAINRMNYKVEFGIYAVGNPNEDSLVFVSANYKLSFDILRQELNGLNAWIMVLDTKGINVWCSAAKGTFGTQEIVNRIKQTHLKELVNHRNLIVPQLGAPGVAAHLVTKYSGFLVIYGPIRATDIQTFLENGMTASKEMRQVRFSFYDRLLLVPTEVVNGLKYLVFSMAVFFFLSGFSKNGYSGEILLNTGYYSTINLSLAYLAGNIIGPLLLPWLPGRRFSLKGLFPGLTLFVFAFLIKLAGKGIFGIIGWILLFSSISSFILMNFTGSSTYTSLSGVKKEMRVAVPLQIAAFVIGVTLWIINRFV